MELRTALVVVVVMYAVSPHTHQPLGVPQELSGSSQAAAGGGQRRGHWLAGHLGGREGRGSAAGDDRAAAATGQGALSAHDAGGAGEAGGVRQTRLCCWFGAPALCLPGLGVGCLVG